MEEKQIQVIQNLADAINNYTAELKRQDPNRLLTVKDIKKEYGVNERTTYKEVFNNPKVITNRLNKSIVIKNSELWKYFDTQH